MRSEVKLSDFGEVIVSARLSLSGEVKPQAEDLTTNVSLVKSDNKFVNLQFLKNTDNDISYKLWLYKFNIEEYHFEFTLKNRTNSYYHEYLQKQALVLSSKIRQGVL